MVEKLGMFGPRGEATTNQSMSQNSLKLSYEFIDLRACSNQICEHLKIKSAVPKTGGSRAAQ